MRRLLALVVLAGCAGDPAEFRPAKSARDYPPTPDAFRIHEPGIECDQIGVVHADPNAADPIADIAATTARHGGTHYVVRDDHTDVVGLETHGSATRLGDSAFVHTRTRAVTRRRVWAVAYRC